MSNTKKSNSHTLFDYKIPKSEEFSRLFYDGSKLYLDIDLGNIEHFNDEGAKEIYKATRIEFHVSAEHKLTNGSQTVPAVVEIQIFHDFVKTSNPKITNKSLLVKKSIVSILLTTDPDEQPDLFMESLGISGKLIIYKFLIILIISFNNTYNKYFFYICYLYS